MFTTMNAYIATGNEIPLMVSIVTWNSAGSIEACLHSLLEQSYKAFNIMIVDNNSSDDTVAIVRKFTDPKIRLITLQENTGFCGGHNFVINHSGSEFILLVNPDIVLQPDYIEKALDTIRQNKSAGTVCGLLLQSADHQNPIIDSAGMDFCRDGRFLLRYHGKKLRDTPLERQEVAGADGALPLYRRQMVDEIKINGQFFDDMFFAHKEDWDVSWRASLLGWKTIFNPDCRALHPRFFKQGNRRMRKRIPAPVKYHAVKNQLLLLLKNEHRLLQKAIFILPRQFGIFLYVVLFERESLGAYRFIIKHRKTILAARADISRKIAAACSGYKT